MLVIEVLLDFGALRIDVKAFAKRHGEPVRTLHKPKRPLHFFRHMLNAAQVGQVGNPRLEVRWIPLAGLDLQFELLLVGDAVVVANVADGGHHLLGHVDVRQDGLVVRRTLRPSGHTQIVGVSAALVGPMPYFLGEERHERDATT